MPSRRGRGRRGDSPKDRTRHTALALVLASATLITLDANGGVEPARAAFGEVYGPVEVVAAGAVRPFVAVPSWFRTHDSLREDLGDLEAENARLRAEVSTAGYDRNRLAELEELTAAAGTLGYALVPARVVGLGAAQSFSRTVTIDAGSRAGLRPDLTVLNNDGLVGRVLRVTRTTATVLLAIDADSVVGGRVGESMEVGFVRGRGEIGDAARVDLELVDQNAVPTQGDTVVTWGSEGGAPYVAGVPVGQVTSVFRSLRESATRVVVSPYADFAALDLVGVVVPSGSSSDRGVIEADGSIR